MSYPSFIHAPEGTKYLKEVFDDGLLPQNCVFDKVLTGCGGSYVALTSPEPYIIAVPTKALVRDKVTSPQYKDYNIQGISEEYLQNLGIINAKATTLGKWYLLKRTAKEGVTCYRIVQRLTDTLVNWQPLILQPFTYP